MFSIHSGTRLRLCETIPTHFAPNPPLRIGTDTLPGHDIRQTRHDHLLPDIALPYPRVQPLVLSQKRDVCFPHTVFSSSRIEDIRGPWGGRSVTLPHVLRNEDVRGGRAPRRTRY